MPARSPLVSLLTIRILSLFGLPLGGTGDLTRNCVRDQTGQLASGPATVRVQPGATEPRRAAVPGGDSPHQGGEQDEFDNDRIGRQQALPG